MYLLIASVSLRLIALGWAIHWRRRVRGAGLWFLTAVVALFALSASLPMVGVFKHDSPTRSEWWSFEEIGDLAESMLLLISVVCIGKMLGERERTMSSLRASEERYRRLLERSADAVLIHDGARWVWVNDAAAAMFRAPSPAAMVGVPVLERVHPDMREAVGARIRAMMARGLPAVRPVEERLVRMDGTIFDAEISATGCEFLGAPAVQVIARDISARKSAEHDLVESRAVLEKAQAVAHVGHWVWTPTRTPELVWSPEALRIYGLKPEEFDGRTESFFPLVHPDDRDRLRRVAEEALKGEPVRRVEHRLVRPDGQERWVLQEGDILPEIDGTFRMIGIVQDITDRKRAQEALRAAHEQLAAVVESSPLPILALDRGGHVQLWNRAAERVFGWSAEEVLGAYNPIVPEEFRPQFEDTLARIMNGESILGMEAARRRKDGSEIDISVSAAPLYNPRGETTGCISLVENVTERKRTQQALRRAEDAAVAWKHRYDAALRVSRQVLYDWDPSSDQMMWGGNTREILGFGPSEPVHLQQWIELAHPDDRAPLKEAIQRVTESRAPFTMEHRVLRQDGTYTDVEETGTFYPSAGGDGGAGGVEGVGGRVLGFISDITRRKRLEDDLRRTQKLDAIGRLASGVAHDFNNLLTAIFGYTSLARRTLSPQHPATRALDRVDEAARQAGGVTKGLLTFSRESPSEKRPLNLARAVDDAVRLVRRTLPAGIELVEDVSRRAPVWVRGDATQLQQVVINLAINARDAMPRGGTLRISLRSVGPSNGDPRGLAELTVSDTGTGIPPELMTRIFEPFFTTKPPGEGTGLGLSIIHGIVSDHGGRIQVDSNPGRGTTFRVLLHLSDVAAAGDAAAPGAEASGHGQLVILGDDHTYVREIVSTMLTSMGFRVVQASDGGAILELYRANRGQVGVLLLDDDMPGCSGWGVVDAVRDSGDPVPAVVMTGTAAEGIDTLPLNTRILRKPFQMTELSAAVAAALAGPAKPAEAT